METGKMPVRAGTPRTENHMPPVEADILAPGNLAQVPLQAEAGRAGSATCDPCEQKTR